jgi:hypothetical protein
MHFELLFLCYMTAAYADMKLIRLEQISHSFCVMGTDIYYFVK